MNNIQQQQQKSSTMTYIILFVVVAGSLLFYFYNSGNSTPESLTLQQVNLTNQADGVRVLNLLNEINTLRIDSAFFSGQPYRTLRDYTVEIPTLPVGRPNPFSPVAGMVTSPAPSTSGR
jgi:hypothetical protein